MRILHALGYSSYSWSKPDHRAFDGWIHVTASAAESLPGYFNGSAAHVHIIRHPCGRWEVKAPLSKAAREADGARFC